MHINLYSIRNMVGARERRDKYLWFGVQLLIEMGLSTSVFHALLLAKTPKGVAGRQGVTDAGLGWRVR